MGKQRQTARQEFPARVITKLRERVGGRCSNPGCRVPTTGPGIGDLAVSSIGVAAHITAAASGGPRYDRNLDEQTRRSIHNAIWLCANCSVDIDRDPVTHTVRSLQRWKVEAEHLATMERGRKLPSATDGIDSVAAALTGLPKHFIPTAVANVHAASSMALESLDPRFAVRSSFDRGVSQFSIEAREPVTVLIDVDMRYEPDAHKKMEALWDFGEELQLNARAVKFEGSKLFEQIFSNGGDGQLVVSPHTKEAIHKVWIQDEKSGKKVQFEDVRGRLQIGRKRISFEGTACGGLFSFTYSKSMEGQNTSATVKVHIDFQRWASLDVRRLPFFVPLKELLDGLGSGSKFVTALVIDGIELLSSKPIHVPEFVSERWPLVRYTHAAAELATYLDVPILFRSDLPFTAEDYEALTRAVEMSKPGGFRFSSVASDITMTLTIGNPADVLLSNLRTGDKADYAITREGEQVTIFGVKVQLPKYTTELRGVKSKCATDLERAKPGDAVALTLVPTDYFHGTMRFIKDEGAEE